MVCSVVGAVVVAGPPIDLSRWSVWMIWSQLNVAVVTQLAADVAVVVDFGVRLMLGVMMRKMIAVAAVASWLPYWPIPTY